MVDSIKTSLIVALAENNCIGLDNRMPWHISDDLKRFKALTTGHPVIMGRKTFESILGYLKKPLPDRTNIIVSRSGFTHNFDDAPVFTTLENAIKHAKTLATTEVFIIGGAQIYTQAIALADTLHLTRVHKPVEGDAFFPTFNENDWLETFREDHPDHDPPYSFLTLNRKT